jgi:hypothetical protein
MHHWFIVRLQLQVTEPEFDSQDSKQGGSWVSSWIKKLTVSTVRSSVENTQLFWDRKVNGEAHTIGYSLEVAYL